MAKVSLPVGWCPECSKKSIDRVDLTTDAEDKLKSLTKKMLVAFMIGDRDGALAEISYQLGITPGELSVAGPWESPKLDRKMARAIAEEILHKFPDVLEELFHNTGMYEKMRRQNEREEQRLRDMNRMSDRYGRMPSMDYGNFGILPEPLTPAKKEYYVPPYSVKKNER